MFADDIKVFVRSDTDDGAINLQKDIELQNWSDKTIISGFLNFTLINVVF